MLYVVEILPVRLVFYVRLQYRRSLGILHSILNEVFYLVVEKQRIDAFVLIVGAYGD